MNPTVGAPGRLLRSGDLTAVAPADDAEALGAANPVRDGSVEIDPAANERREAAIVAKVLRADVADGQSLASPQMAVRQPIGTTAATH